MYQSEEEDTVKQSLWVATVAFITLVYSLVVRDLRTEHKNAALGILISVAQPIVAGLVFYVFITMMGGGLSKIRGDNLTFIVMGFVVFFMHIRTVGAVAGALREDMLNHQRLSPFLLVSVKAISSGYKIILALIIMIALNYLLRDVYEMQNLLHFMGVIFWCWIGGIAIGILFLAAIRYFTWGGLLHTTYTRIMFFTSGKFFIANTLPGFIRPLMDWNPLFHLLDQSRDAAFVNYTARTTSMEYPIVVYLVILVLAMLIEHYVRTNYSQSHMPGG